MLVLLLLLLLRPVPALILLYTSMHDVPATGHPPLLCIRPPYKSRLWSTTSYPYPL